MLCPAKLRVRVSLHSHDGHTETRSVNATLGMSAPYSHRLSQSHRPPPPSPAGTIYSNHSQPSHHERSQSQTIPGFRSQHPRAPPPGADPVLWGWFTSVDVDGSNSITADELRKALVNGDWSLFDQDTIKMLMGLFDTDHSGTINFNEFAGLWKYVNDWQGVFRHFDQDGSGSIDGRELRRALSNFGYNLSNHTLNIIEQRYAVPPDEYGRPVGITFDRFVRACVAVKTLTEAFQRVDTDRDGWINVNYDQFINMALSAP